MIPRRPWKTKRPMKVSRKQRDARGAREVRRNTSSIHSIIRYPGLPVISVPDLYRFALIPGCSRALPKYPRTQAYHGLMDAFKVVFALQGYDWMHRSFYLRFVLLTNSGGTVSKKAKPNFQTGETVSKKDQTKFQPQVRTKPIDRKQQRPTVSKKDLPASKKDLPVIIPCTVRCQQEIVLGQMHARTSADKRSQIKRRHYAFWSLIIQCAPNVATPNVSRLQRQDPGIPDMEHPKAGKGKPKFRIWTPAVACALRTRLVRTCLGLSDPTEIPPPPIARQV